MMTVQLELYASLTGVGRGAGGIEPCAMPSSDPVNGADVATTAGRDGAGRGVGATLIGVLAGDGRDVTGRIERDCGAAAARTSTRVSATCGAARGSAAR
jgi:hypothetical protein